MDVWIVVATLIGFVAGFGLATLMAASKRGTECGECLLMQQAIGDMARTPDVEP